MTYRGLIDGAMAATLFKEIGLYKNRPTLSKGWDASTMDECDFSGYARITLNSFDWSSPPVIDSNGNATITHPELTWTKSGPIANADVWGIFLVSTDSPFPVLFAQEFSAAPYPMVTDGDLIRFQPVYSVGNPIF
jgi:hypothetical protein